jgi:hypothetical protein
MPALLREANLVERLASAVHASAAMVAATTRKPVLVALLHARLKAALRRLFDLLSLAYPPADMRAAEGAVLGASATARAGAIELLDNVLRGPHREPLMRALETVVLPRRGMALARDATWAALLQLDDSLVRREVARAARSEGVLAAELREVAARDPDPAVRRAAHAGEEAHAEGDEPRSEVELSPGWAY